MKNDNDEFLKGTSDYSGCLLPLLGCIFGICFVILINILQNKSNDAYKNFNEKIKNNEVIGCKVCISCDTNIVEAHYESLVERFVYMDKTKCENLKDKFSKK